MLSAKIDLSHSLSVRKSGRNILYEISRFWIVWFKILTDMESALNCEDSDIKICVRTCSWKLFKIRMNNMLSAKKRT